MTNSSVAIVVLNWNNIEATTKCIDSLEQQTYDNYSIIVVDNGSTQDDTSDELARFEKKHYTVLRNNTNLGFAGGVNTGIRHALDAKFEYIALINNDAITDKQWLRSLVDAVQTNEDTGISTGLFLDETGKFIDSTGEQYSNWGLPFPRDRNKPVHSAPNSSNVFGATGGASLYSANMLRNIGLFDEDFFAYYEDVDISFRAQLAGWKVTYEPKAIAYHERGQTSVKISGLTTRMHFQNLPMICIKNIPMRLLPILSIKLGIMYSAMFVKSATRGDGIYAFKGVLKAVQLLPRKIAQRRTIQSNKSVTNTYIKSILHPGVPPRD